MTEVEYWVLHSPYPDKSWRGIEKCALSDDYNLLLFETELEAIAFIHIGEMEEWFEPVKVTLCVPDVRESLVNNE